MHPVLNSRARALGTAMVLLAALALPFAASAVPASAAPASAKSAATASVAAVQADTAAKVPRYDHIAVIMFTSHDYGSILHNRFAPTFNRLASQYGLASHYYTTSDPDTANVMALLAGNDFGISDGAPYWDSRVNKPSLLSQIDKAHMSWKEYAQGLPYPGYLGDCYPGNCIQTDSLYNQIQFNAVPDLTSVADNPAEARKMVPATQLSTDAKTGHLPNFSFIDPNECAGMHGGPPWCEDSSSNYHQFDDNALVSGGDSLPRAGRARDHVRTAVEEGQQRDRGVLHRGRHQPRLLRRQGGHRSRPHDRDHQSRATAPDRPGALQPLLAAAHDRGRLRTAMPRARV